MKNSKLPLLALAVAVLGFLAKMQAQTPQNDSKTSENLPVHLRLLARNYGDRISLRWAFSEPEAWRYLNKQGFMLERFVLDDASNQPISQHFEPLSPTLLRPWAKEQWAARVTAADTFAVIAAECLLGETQFPAESNFFRQLDLVQQDAANRTAFALLAADLSPLAAEGLGLRFEDRDVKPGKKYIYRLRVTDDAADRFVTDTAMYIVATDKMYAPERPMEPEITPGDSLVNLKWRKMKGFTAYFIERSADGGATWGRLTKLPYFNMIDPKIDADRDYVAFSDRLPRNYEKHLYRLRGVTPFGEISEACEPVEGMGVDLTPAAPPKLTFAENTKPGTVELRWEMPNMTDCKGFVVAKATSGDGPWLPLTETPLPPTARNFTDAKASEFERNFYRVWSLDEHNNTASSYPAYIFMHNTAPPAAPIGFSGSIDTSGLVTLRWRRGAEPDLWGYQVFYANQKDHEPVPLTNDVLQDTSYSYRIPLDNLSEKIYYVVYAFDLNYARSAASELLELHKPDKVAPTTPLIRNYAVRDTGVLVEWAPSESWDVAKHTLLRREKGSADWVKLAELPKDARRYFDAATKPETEYDYTVFATDDANLSSARCHPLHVRTLPIVLREPIENLRCTASAEQKTVRLTWAYPSEKEKVAFKIYRIKPNGGLQLLGETAGRDTKFEDKSVRAGAEYRYAVRAFHREGGASPVARTEAVRI